MPRKAVNVWTRRFAETPGGPPRLVLSYFRTMFGELRQLEATWDGRLVHYDPRRDARGAPFVHRLPDGRLLSIRPAVTHFVLPALDVRIDDRPLPGSAYDPRRYLRHSAQVLGCLALLRLLAAAPIAFDAYLEPAWWYAGKSFRLWFVAEAAFALFLFAPAVGIRLGSRGWAFSALVVASCFSFTLFATMGNLCCFSPLDLATLICTADAFDRIGRFRAGGLTVGS